jgi:lysophospholipase L1-like esterase
MVFGDSNAFRPDGSNTCWATLLEDKDPVHLNVFNESCDGRTTQYDTGERNGLSVIGNKLTSHAPLDYVIVMLGTNDVKSKYGPPSATDIADGVEQILDFIVAYGGGVEPILVTPPPLGDVTSGDLAGAQLRIPPIAVEYRLLAMDRDIHLIDINAIIDSRTDLEPDKVHLNGAGRQKVADVVWANLKNMALLPSCEEKLGHG